MSKTKFQLFGELRHDLPAGVIVFLVAVPLCLGIALASGASLFSGIISGFVGGIVVGIVSKSPLGVSGPAAGLTVIVLNAINQLGSFESFLLAVVIAGVIQFILGIIQAGIIGYYFPGSVIKGMLTAIGIIIILKQIPHTFGYDKDYEGDMSFSQSDGHNTFSELYYMIDAISPGAVLVSIVSLTVLILWEQKFIKSHKLFQLVQGPLVVVAFGILYTYIISADSRFYIQPEHMVSLPVPESLGAFFGQFTYPDFSMITNPEVYVVAFTIAVVASIETLLCVEATDKLDPYKRNTPANRELIAQGTGNIVSGLLGGIPVTQVIVRSSANIQSGGRTKMAAIFHGILMFASVMFIPQVLNKIPLASLATILLLVGYKLAKPSIFKDVARSGKSQLIPFLVTVIGIIFTDLLVGIGLGMAVGIAQILWQNYKIPYHFDESGYKNGEPIILQLAENVSFLNKAGLLHTFDSIPNGSTVIIDATRSLNIHHDVRELIEDFKINAVTRDINLVIKGLETSAEEKKDSRNSRTKLFSSTFNPKDLK